MNDQTPRHDLPAVLTTSDLAAYLGVPVQTIHDLRRTDRGPRAFHVGRELRYLESDVKTWIAELQDEDATRRRGSDS